MGLFDKLKNIFIEEEAIEDEAISNIKPIVEEKIEIDEVKDETTKIPVDENTMSDRSLIDTNQNFKFPIIFEDDDFKEEKKKTKSINVLERENNKYEEEVKKEIKPQKKSFKPSPVISPVYGVLDKNYSKEDITSKDGLLNDYDEKIDIDYVIKKAYGSEKEILSKEESKENENIINLFEDNNIDDIDNKESSIDSKVPEVEEYSVEEIDEKIKSIDDLLQDTSDEDFYSLVDSMYKDDEGDEQ